ncbi:MAG: VanZ family protein [Planctomycetota bacterium]
MSATPASRLPVTIALVLVVAYAALIFGGSSREAPEAITDLEIPDFLLHMVEYGGLGFLLSRWLRLWTGRTDLRTLVLIPAVLGTLYGITDEIHQGFVPERDGSPMDVAADALGAALGAAAYFVPVLIRGRRSPSA